MQQLILIRVCVCVCVFSMLRSRCPDDWMVRRENGVACDHDIALSEIADAIALRKNGLTAIIVF